MPAPALDELADRGLAEPGSEPIRTAMALRAQQAYGNAAVQRMLQRLPNPELADKEPTPVPETLLAAPEGERAAAPSPEATPEMEDGKETAEELETKTHATGKQIDAYLDASPFIKKYVEAKVKAGTKAEGHVHIDEPAAFKTACIAYLKARGKTEAQATAMEPNVNAFRDGTEIHVHKERGEFATTIHESMHLFSHDDYRGKLGFNANEGATEFFTRKICAEQTITRGNYYPDEYKSTKQLADLVGEDKLAEAYYNGKVDELGAALDAAKAAGTWTKWKQHIAAGEYAKADALTVK